LEYSFVIRLGRGLFGSWNSAFRAAVETAIGAIQGIVTVEAIAIVNAEGLCEPGTGGASPDSGRL
jgi:hypothetical protein